MYHINTILVKESDIGQHGNLFGGRLLYVLDESAASFAMQICDTPNVVTVSKHNVYTGNQKVILKTKITFVRVDDDGQPIPIAERVHRKYEEIKNINGRG